MIDNYTPARLRELAKRHEQNAAELREYEETCRDAGSWRDDQEQMITPESEEETAAALRAAADQNEALHIQWQEAVYLANCRMDLLDEATATLAAQEALLTKALDVLEDHFLHRRLALAAEIAAALKETDQ